jgi:GTP-binding protein HflX
LADTAGAAVVGRVSQALDRPNPATYVGSGKAKEVAALAESADATLVVVDSELTPGQQLRLEEAIPGPKVIDRTALILDVFAQHAHSREGKLQVELAQLEYNLPRLRGLGVVLSRQGRVAAAVGIGTRGPGETQLEVDRRVIRRRISQVKRELEDVAKDRMTQRKGRKRPGVFRVSLVGYTNAGKSTLLGALTHAEVYVADQLFATLDSTSRKLDLGEGIEVVLTDTVGFVDKLPHQLVAAFRSTLDEVREADLLLHVMDASHPELAHQRGSVERVLGEIGAAEIGRLEVANKIDRLDQGERDRLAVRSPFAIPISALDGTGLDELRRTVEHAALVNRVRLSLLVPYSDSRIVESAHRFGRVLEESHEAQGTRLVVDVDRADAPRFERWTTKG